VEKKAATVGATIVDLLFPMHMELKDKVGKILSIGFEYRLK
jgi:hypothetical protein